MARPARIPRRTPEIELWDVNPVGTRDAWRRELLQFWSLMLTRGRRVRSPSWLMVREPEGLGYRAITVPELASRLASRVAHAPGAMVDEDRQRELERWLADAIIIPGERRKRTSAPPAAGVATAHYLGLHLFNRGATRERFWSSFFYSALQNDLGRAGEAGRGGTPGQMIDSFLSLGLDDVATRDGALSWSVDFRALSRREPETLIVARAVTTDQRDAPDGLSSAAAGLPSAYFANTTDAATYKWFLCPGVVVLMRRSLKLLLDNSDAIGHAALGEMIEASLAGHAALYFVRGLRVLNELVERRGLPPDCAACQVRFQSQLVGDDPEAVADPSHPVAATAADAAFVESTCEANDGLFVNAGRKELTAARDLARLSLEELRRKLALYTVNRILLKVASDVCGRLAKTVGHPEPRVSETLALLDTWSDNTATRMALSLAWDEKIEELSQDPDVPGPTLETLEARRSAAAGDPRALEGVARDVISEAILSSRAFTRYIELLHSLLGGGALPSNEDPKGFMARGGTKQVPFHLTVNDKALEHLVAVAFLESRAAGTSLSFPAFVDFLNRRYHLSIDTAPESLGATSGLVADATSQSREALRRRLLAMGMLEEYSDSSEWNRVKWGPVLG